MTQDNAKDKAGQAAEVPPPRRRPSRVYIVVNGVELPVSSRKGLPPICDDGELVEPEINDRY